MQFAQSTYHIFNNLPFRVFLFPSFSFPSELRVDVNNVLLALLSNLVFNISESYTALLSMQNPSKLADVS